MRNPFTRSGTSPEMPLKKLPPAVIPARRDAVRSLTDLTTVAGKMTRRSYRSMMKGAATTRLERTWSTSPQSADEVIYKNLRTLVARSRSEFLDGDYPKQFIRMVKKNVVGEKGFYLKSTPRDKIGGEIDVPAKDAIEAAWKVQSKRGNFDTTGQMSRATFEQLWISTCALDGEGLALIVTGEDAGPTGFSVQQIDTMRLDPQHNAQLSGGRFIRAGIEYNQYGKPLAYHIAEESNEVYGSFLSTSRNRIEASRVIHAYIPELAGQRRGIPWMHTALWRLHNVKGFEDSAVVNARVGAAKMGFFGTKDDEEDQEDEIDPSTGELVERNRDIEIDAEPGTFHDMGNREFKEFNPTFPEQSTESFIKVQLRGVAAGLGVSYNSLANDLTSVNFSSLREGKLDERATWLLLQGWQITSFNDPLYEAWIRHSVLAGTIKVNGRPLRMDRLEKYLSHEFKGRRWPWVDPKSEMLANEVALRNRLTSRTRIMEDMHHGDPWDVFKEMADEEEDMQELGVEIPTLPGASVLPTGKGATPPDDDDDQDDE